jgi:hypothetical protein
MNSLRHRARSWRLILSLIVAAVVALLCLFLSSASGPSKTVLVQSARTAIYNPDDFTFGLTSQLSPPVLTRGLVPEIKAAPLFPIPKKECA